MGQRLLLPLAGLPILVVLAWFRIRAGAGWRTVAVQSAFVLYALLVAGMVFLPLYLDPVARAIQAESAARFGTGWFSPVPFHTIGALLRRTTPTQLALAIGNFALLLPLGFLAPAALPRLRTVRRFSAAALGTAVFIEAVQLLERVAGLSFRSVDIDDVILNTLGALIGFGLFELLALVARRMRGAGGPRPRGERGPGDTPKSAS